MRDAIKTVILVVILSVVGFIAIGFGDNIQKGVELLSRTKLPLSDPTIQILYPRIENNFLLRKPDLDTSNLSSEEIIEYFFDNLTNKDYKTRKVEAVKIYCTISNAIQFISENEKDCNLLVIANSTIKNKQKEVFNTDYDLSFSDIDYKGYQCKNDGKRYYCMKKKYVNHVVGYSVFKDAYEDKDGVVIHEYYLNIDLSKREVCLNYFSNEYCSNYTKMDRQKIDNDKVKQSGVLYEHLFVKDGDNYYLKRSFVVSS